MGFKPKDGSEHRLYSANDRKGMLEIQERFPENFEETLESYKNFSLPDEVKINSTIKIRYVSPANVVVVGLGGSAIGGDLVRRWRYANLCVPFETCRGYELPGYVDKQTLVLVVSYSGDTEETLSCFVEAVRKGCMVVGVASEGRLINYCGKLGYPILRVPAGYPPRSALPFILAALIIVLDRVGLIKDYQGEVDEAVVVLKKIRDETGRDIPLERNLAKQVATEFKGVMPVIYADRVFGEVALRWKTQFNENRKIHARVEVFPELNHNELVGWESANKTDLTSTVVMLRDSDEDEPTKARVEVTKEVLEARGIKVIELYPDGKTPLAKILYLTYLGDVASLYSAVDASIDPFETAVIHKVKDQLKEKINLQSKLDKEVEKIARG